MINESITHFFILYLHVRSVCVCVCEVGGGGVLLQKPDDHVVDLVPRVSAGLALFRVTDLILVMFTLITNHALVEQVQC